MRFSVGMGQMLVEGGRAEANLARAEAVIAAAARRGCSALVLPECLDLGWTDPSAHTQAEPIPGPHSDRLCAAARRAGLHIAAGLTERDGERLYNAAVLISPEGRILALHRKITVLDIARDTYAVGDRLCVAHTPLGVIGLNICADNWPTSLELAHSLGRMGCRLLLTPSAWAVDADHDDTREPYGGAWKKSYRELARLYGMTTIGVSNVGAIQAGPWAGKKCIGRSLAVGPDGRVLAHLPYGEEAETLEVVEVDVTPAEALGERLGHALAEKGGTPR